MSTLAIASLTREQLELESMCGNRLDALHPEFRGGADLSLGDPRRIWRAPATQTRGTRRRIQAPRTTNRPDAVSQGGAGPHGYGKPSRWWPSCDRHSGGGRKLRDARCDARAGRIVAVRARGR